ncbi:MAG: hypothetical protein Q4F17_05105 [Eubacteriales bacterium]|nr:hypothetical protein [Eubacteriales bacterium]
MYHGKYQPMRPRRRHYRKAGTLLLSCLLLLTLAIGGTLAYLTTDTAPVENSFTPAKVDCTVTEEFNGTTKSNVNVTNTGNINAYLRVKLVTYRVNDEGQHIGGTAEIPSFTPGDGWKPLNGYYYYTKPVAPGDKPASDLISSINLTGSYDDADGGKQVIEVMAEAIQADGTNAEGKTPCEIAWGVKIESGTVTSVA